MSKRDLKTYLHELTKDQLEEQVLDLYTKFKSVKTYYNFAFSPKEDKLLEEAKFKISKEYFPPNDRRPKARRSVAQKTIKHFIQLGVDINVISDLMLFNIEVAQQFSLERQVKQEAFYKSILNSFQEAVKFITDRGLLTEYMPRISKIITESKNQDWMNYWAFEDAINPRFCVNILVKIFIFSYL